MCMYPTCLLERRGRLRLTQAEEGEAGRGKVRGACEHMGRREAAGVPGVHLAALAHLRGCEGGRGCEHRGRCRGVLEYPAGARGRLTHGAGEARWKGREVANLEKEAVPRQPELVGVRGEAQEVVRRDQVPEGGLPLRGHHMEDAALPLAVVPQLRGRHIGTDAAPEHAAPPREQ